MKKLFLPLLIAIISIFLLDAFEGGSDYYWNPELFIEKPSSIASINHFIVDAGINSPVGGWGPQIKFRTGYLLTDKFRLGISGEFYNILNANTQFVENKTWYQNPEGADTGDIQTERELKYQEWDAINNELKAYLGYRYSDSIRLGFSFSGGSRISAFKLREVDFTRTFVQGSSNLTANYTDTTSDEKLGYGYLNFGAGINLTSDFFKDKAPVISQIKIDTFFDFQINGNGSPANAASTFATVYTYDTTNSKIARTITQNRYSYFGFLNSGRILLDLHLNKVVKDLDTLSLFAITTAFSYALGTKYYYDYFNKTQNDNLVNNDYAINPFTTSKFDYHLIGKIGVNVELDVRPVEAVQIRLGYGFVYDGVVYKTISSSITDTSALGVRTVVTNPESENITGRSTLNHTVEARFRFVFPLIVRLTLGGVYNVTQTIVRTEDSHKSNTVKTDVNGAVTETLGTVSVDKNIKTTYTVNQVVNPYLGLDFELMKDTVVLALNWSPKLAVNSSADTNLLNLACWSISTVIRFIPGKKVEPFTMRTNLTDVTNTSTSSNTDTKKVEEKKVEEKKEEKVENKKDNKDTKKR